MSFVIKKKPPEQMASSAQERESVGKAGFVAFAVLVRKAGNIWKAKSRGSRWNTHAPERS